MHQIALRKAISNALHLLSQYSDEDVLKELLPLEVLKKLPTFKEALFYLHNPPISAITSLLCEFKHPSQERLIFEELLAHRLGLYAIKSELEDLSFKYTDRDTFETIKNKLKKSKDIRERFIRKFVSPIKKSLDGIGLKYDIKVRTKSIHSINSKMN